MYGITRRKSFLILRGAMMVAIVAAAFFAHSGVLLPDIMESRNVVAAREMVDEGHWLVPTMNGTLRLEKPPLPTWLTAAARRAVDEVAGPAPTWQAAMVREIVVARAAAGLAAGLAVLFFWLTARRVVGIDPWVATLLLCTCYSVILMGRTASWDIYCHAFQLGGIYFLARGLAPEGRAWRWVAAGVFTGLSVLSKGPVSPYALLLPFLIAYILVYRPSVRGKVAGLAWGVIAAVVVGGSWFVYVRTVCPAEWAAAMTKESGAWLSHNVRPWWYYAPFFQEAGVWALLLLTALVWPLFDQKMRGDRRWRLAAGWTIGIVVLLSLLPEKKNRYLLPMLIPAAYAMGWLVTQWERAVRRGCASRLCRAVARVNVVAVAVAVAVLPVAAWWFAVRAGLLSWAAWAAWAALAWTVGAVLLYAARRLRVTWMVGGVAAMFFGTECLFMPAVGRVAQNPEMHSLAATRGVEELSGLPFYRLADEPMRIELVYAAGRTIRPVTREELCHRVPCVLLTRRPVADEDIDTTCLRTQAIGVYDDNRRPRSSRRYSDSFIYHVTLLQDSAGEAVGTD